MVFLGSLVLIIIFVIVLYKWSTIRINELKERGVSHDKPLPLFGNVGLDMMLGKTSFLKMTIELHQRYKHCKVYGLYYMRNPFIIVSDAELIKKVCIDDFHNFNEHKEPYEDTDSDFGRNLYILKGIEWRKMREILAPTFTANKIQHFYELIDECCMEGINYLEEKILECGQEGLELKMDDIFARLSNDIIASVALGIKVVSFRQKENSFFKIGSSVFNIRSIQLFKVILIDMMPKVMKFLGFKAFDARTLKYFNSLILSTIKYRELHNIGRFDMINLLLAAKNENYIKLSNDDIVAQCLLCYCAGFGKISPTLCFAAHEIMESPHVQEQLYQEILAVQNQLDGKPLSYEALMNMKYLDMVIAETLRKWPPYYGMDRVCIQDYDLKDADGNIIVRLKKNDDIWISILGLHWDPENFESPEKFIPERFSAENTAYIKPFTFLPFGVGPRKCLGIQLAVIEMKAIMYHILSKFEIVSSAKTAKSLSDAMHGFRVTPGSFWLKLIPRSNSSESAKSSN